jgi:hypothetical protein
VRLPVCLETSFLISIFPPLFLSPFSLGGNDFMKSWRCLAVGGNLKDFRQAAHLSMAGMFWTWRECISAKLEHGDFKSFTKKTGS